MGKITQTTSGVVAGHVAVFSDVNGNIMDGGPLPSSSGSGTVTTVSVATANGFSGTVANATTTPTITMGTSVTGLLKGNGTAMSAAVVGTDYQRPISLTTTGTSGAATFNSGTGVLNVPTYLSSALGPYATALLGQLPGTTTNDSASAGNIGEYVYAGVTSGGSGTNLTSGSLTTVTSIALTAGDWDVSANMYYSLSTSTSSTDRFAALNTAASFPGLTFGSAGTDVMRDQAVITTTGSSAQASLKLGPTRISLASSGTVYLLDESTFTGTIHGGGWIEARRVR